MLSLPVPNVLEWGLPIQTRPIRFFKFVWGLTAGTKDHKKEVVDSAPLWQLDTGIGCQAVIQSILVSNCHSGADYLNLVPD